MQYTFKADPNGPDTVQGVRGIVTEWPDHVCVAGAEVFIADPRTKEPFDISKYKLLNGLAALGKEDAFWAFMEAPENKSLLRRLQMVVTLRSDDAMLLGVVDILKVVLSLTDEETTALLENSRA